MNRFIFIFTTQEIEYLAKKRPDLVPKKKPSLKDKLLEKPSLKDKLIDRPSLDQVILKFLSKYEVFIEPRSVGAWNGWDTISVLNPFLFNDGSTQSYLSDISSNIFFANRSNQIRSSAQEWNTWKRWALDHNEFEEYKKQFLETVDIHNEKIKKEEEKLIREAELHNQKVYTEEEKLIREAESYNKKIIEVLEESKAKTYISRLIKRDKLKKKRLISYIKNTLKILIPLPFLFLLVNSINETRYMNKIYRQGDSYKFIRSSVKCRKSLQNEDIIQCAGKGYLYKQDSEDLRRNLTGGYLDCVKIKKRRYHTYFYAICEAADSLGKI